MWAKGAGEISVNAVSKTLSPNWQFYEWKVNGMANITINANGNQMDDVRLYPKSALMTTYTYDPLTGIKSSTDTNNNTTYYHYDQFNRLKLIQDQNGNIVKQIEYNYSVR